MSGNSQVISPPRLLLGVTLLFWGGVTGHPFLGLLCAFALEARWWVDLRWKSSELGFVRAWHLSFVLLLLASAWLWLAGENALRLFDLLMWMPVLFLPVVLSQQYALTDTMPLNTFSFVARHKMLADRAAGRPVHPIRVHVGYAYFCLVLLAAALGRPGDMVSFAGMAVLAVAALYCSSPPGRRRSFSWGAAMLVVLAMSFVGVLAMQQLFAFLGGAGIRTSGVDGVGDEARTAIGSIGKIKQSNRIRWRVSGIPPQAPDLFRTASFNRYGRGIWNHRPEERIPRVLDYKDMILGGTAADKIWAFRQEDLASGNLGDPDLRIRGEADEMTVLPLPETVRALRGLAVDGVTWNPLGTVVAENPDHPVIDFSVSLGDANLTESPPNETLDLYIPPGDAGGVERTCNLLGLRELPDQEKIDVLRAFFRNNFTYSLDLDAGLISGPMASMAITRFLEVSREGHCEYYGTAAALLLREAGLPTRYCEGFAVRERDHKRAEWLLRGCHAHSWCRAYLGGTRTRTTLPDGTQTMRWSGGRWVDVDLTPPSNFGTGGGGLSWSRSLLDWFQRTREDILLWRTRPGNRRLVDLVMATIATLLFTYVAVRIWKSRTRRRITAIAGFRPHADVPLTPLHGLERLAEPWLGTRPAGTPLTRWLLQLADSIPTEKSSLTQATALHAKLRFDPAPPKESERQQLDSLCKHLRKRLKSRWKSPQTEPGFLTSSQSGP